MGNCAKPATPNPLPTTVQPICKGNALLTAHGNADVHGKHHLPRKILDCKKSHEEKGLITLNRK